MHVKQELADRIRKLCAQALDAPDTEMESILTELRSALQKHLQELRHMVAEGFRLTPRDD